MSWFQQNAPAAGDPTTGQGINERGPVAPEGGDQSAQIQQMWQQFSAGKPPGTETLQQFIQFLGSKGITGVQIPTRGGGALSSDKLVLPNQQVVDVWGDVGGANTPTWANDGYWVNGQPSSTPGVVTNPMAGEGGGMSNLGSAGLASGYLSTPWGGSVGMPDPAKMMDDPAYQWTLQRGLDAGNKHHAARGTILGGGAQKDAMEFAAGLATDTWDKNFGRNMAIGEFNRGTHWGDTDRLFNRFSNLTGMGLDAEQNYSNNVSSIYGQQASANAANTLNQGSSWGNLAGSGSDWLMKYFADRDARGGA